MNCKKLSFVALLTLLSACQEEDKSVLSLLKTPGDIIASQTCVTQKNGKNIYAGSDNCTGESKKFIAVTNPYNNSLVIAERQGEEYRLIDLNASVPGSTGIRVGDRPSSLAVDGSGVIIVTASTLNSDLSITDVVDGKEIAFTQLDAPVRKIIHDPVSKHFILFMSDGNVRTLDLSYDCGEGKGVFVEGCNLKDTLKITIENSEDLHHKINDAVLDADNRKAYVTHSGLDSVSVLALDDKAASCAKYPCFIEHIGANFECSDGIDNNGDGLADADDPNCFAPWNAESSGGTGLWAKSECNDGIDNDNDGVFDMLDPGCVAFNDGSESAGLQKIDIGSCKRDSGSPFECFGAGSPKNETIRNKSLPDATSPCNDGVDNDNDGKIDENDAACYHKFGFAEYVPQGRHAVAQSINKKYLYVLDKIENQVVVIDIENKKVISAYGKNPYHTGIGINVVQFAQAIAPHAYDEEIRMPDGSKVNVHREVVLVGNAGSAIVQYTVEESYKHGDNVYPTRLILEPTDNDAGSSHVASVRCLFRVCEAEDLPEITLRKAPAYTWDESNKKLIFDDKNAESRQLSVSDRVNGNEIWRLYYDADLMTDSRRDGQINPDGNFEISGNFCELGVREGDRLRIMNTEDLVIPPDAACDEYRRVSKSGEKVKWEWKIDDIRSDMLKVSVLDGDEYIKIAPSKQCLPQKNLRYNIRAPEQWRLTNASRSYGAKLTYANRCHDDPRLTRNDRFFFGNKNTTPFFDFTFAKSSEKANAQHAFEINIRSGLRSVNMSAYGHGGIHSMLILPSADNQRKELFVTAINAGKIQVFDLNSYKDKYDI